MFGFKGVEEYERGVARRERVAPFLSAPFLKHNGYSLFLTRPNIGRVGLATRPRSVFLPPM